MDSILTSIKKLLGIGESYTHFDTDIIIGINTSLSILSQLGVGEKSFSIEDKDAEWKDFLPDMSNLELVKSYIHMKVKLMFDPPQSSAVIEVMNKQISELEWRINELVDPGKEETINETTK